MRIPLLSVALGLSLSALACGGNVNVAGSGGSGGTGTGTGTAGSTSTSTSTEDFFSCSGPGQCTLASAGCCSQCGKPSLADFTAVNAAKLVAYHKFVCPEPVPCPECAPQFDPNLIAYCSAGKCIAADVRTDPLSACNTTADCHLRNGAECCESCGENQDAVIAVSYTANPQLADLMCTPDVGCPKCLPQYPPGLVPACGSDGHCIYVGGGGSGP